MKVFYFKRDCKNFDDIVKDSAIKNRIRTKISWHNHLILVFDEDKDDSIFSYIVLKYSEWIIPESELIKDRAPVMYKDYQPRDPEGFLKRHPIAK